MGMDGIPANIFRCFAYYVHKLYTNDIVSCFNYTNFLGAVWPMEGQPQILRKVSELLPIRLVGNTMNNIALKGWTLGHPSIVIGTTATFAYTILFVLVLIILGKIKKDLWVLQK